MVTHTRVRNLHKQQSPHVQNNNQTHLDSEIQHSDTASTSNIENLEGFKSKALRMRVDASWYVSNTVIQRDFQTPTVKEEVRSYSSPQRTAKGKYLPTTFLI
jgi:hypothetical protein